jgi:dTMP kinase
MSQGRFITVEGIEGVGKSTSLDAICTYLQRRGVEVVRTREPGGTAVGEAVRGLLLSRELPAMGPETELLLMFAARAEHLRRLILPALEAGKWVVCDRFTDASYAYQGAGRDIPDERIATLEDWVQGGLSPELTILLDADVRIGLGRVHARGETDRFERETLAFFERVRGCYRRRAEAFPQRFRIVDAGRSLESVTRYVIAAVQTLFGQGSGP